MTHGQTDPRVERTDELLQTALIELAAERGFEAVTIGEIAKRARVNRATFYRHYRDKYDLVEQILQQAIDQFSKELEPPGLVVITTDPQNPPERWVRFFEHFREHEQLYRALLGPGSGPWVAARMRSYFINMMGEREQLRDRLASRERKMTRARMPKPVAITLTANLLISTVAWWLESGKQYSAREIASWVIELLVNGYAHAIGVGE